MSIKNTLKYMLSTALLTASCQRPETWVHLKSESHTVYDSVVVRTSKVCEGTVFTKVTKNFRGKKTIDFCERLKSDGAYALTLYKNGQQVYSQAFGYYTNGSSLNEGFDLTIKSDNVVVIDEK